MKLRKNGCAVLLFAVCCYAATASPSLAAEGRVSLNELATQFADPGVEYRAKPFWSWNGELKEDELIRQIRVLKEMGMGGVFMHSRIGLETEYLGEEWFRLINSSADEAERLGMQAWLYDEDRWPSGTAGGLVTRNPKYRIQYLNLRMVPTTEFHWQNDIFAAFACDVAGTRFTRCTRLTRETLASLPAGETTLVFTVGEEEKTSFYNGLTDVDRLNREATDYFIQLTHEQYKVHAGNRFGKSIKGIFTDEMNRGLVMSSETLRTPWTEAVPAQFRERFGYDLVERLPELFLYKDGLTVSPVKWHYMELLQSMFLENWAKPIHEWCRRNNLLLTGHALNENSLTDQAVPQGSLMRFYEYLDYPGVDVLTEENRNYWIVKQLASVARQLGQKWLLSELYGLTGWQFNFESHKYVGDWQALFGINLRCQHLSWYTMAGEAKRDYPASISFQSAWWKDYKFIEDYYSRLGLMVTQGEPVRDVLVLNPVESVWAQIGPGWAEELSAKAKEIQDLERAYAEVFHWLAGSHIDFDYGDEEMIGHLYKVERDEKSQPVLRVGYASYRVVVVPKMITIRSTSLKLLDEFRRAGGKVVFLGEPPAYVDAVKSGAAAEFAARAQQVPWDPEALRAACKGPIQMPVEILDPANGKPLNEVFCQLRVDGDRRTLVAMNMNREKWFRGAQIRVKTTGHLSEWDCATGRRSALSTQSKDGWTEWTTDFPPIGEHVFVMTSKPEQGLIVKPTFKEVKRQAATGPFEYELSEPNICVLDMARFRINDGNGNPETEVLKIDRDVRRAFGLPFRSGDMIQPWFSRKFEPKPDVRGKLTMIFEFQVEVLPESPVDLGIEEPENFHLTLNGHALPSSSVNGWWVDPAIKTIPLPTDALAKGLNKLEVTTDFRQDVNIEALYLLGRFGVRVNGTQKTLTRLPANLLPTDLVTQGLPFYSGAVTFRVPVASKARGGQRIFIKTPKFEAACIKVKSGKEPARMIAWQPYLVDITDLQVQNGLVELEVLLTRRNTFGPLHLVPKQSPLYGPPEFRTEGKAWSQEYQLYPSGLLEAPVVTVCTIE